MPETVTTYFALYVSDAPGPVDPDDEVSAICVALFGDCDDAITEARENLKLGYSVSIDVGAMTEAEWDALEEVPDDFRFPRPPAADAVAARS